MIDCHRAEARSALVQVVESRRSPVALPAGRGAGRPLAEVVVVEIVGFASADRQAVARELHVVGRRHDDLGGSARWCTLNRVHSSRTSAHCAGSRVTSVTSRSDEEVGRRRRLIRTAFSIGCRCLVRLVDRTRGGQQLSGGEPSDRVANLHDLHDAEQQGSSGRRGLRAGGASGWPGRDRRGGSSCPGLLVTSCAHAQAPRDRCVLAVVPVAVCAVALTTLLPVAWEQWRSPVSRLDRARSYSGFRRRGPGRRRHLVGSHNAR